MHKRSLQTALRILGEGIFTDFIYNRYASHDTEIG